MSPHSNAAIIAGGEDVTVVGGDGVDGAVVRLHLPHQSTGLRVPELDSSCSASRHHNVTHWEVGETTDPVLVSIVETLHQLLTLEVPLLDAGVS